MCASANEESGPLVNNAPLTERRRDRKRYKVSRTKEICRETVPPQKKRCGSSNRSSKTEVSPFSGEQSR